MHTPKPSSLQLIAKQVLGATHHERWVGEQGRMAGRVWVVGIQHLQMLENSHTYTSHPTIVYQHPVRL